MELKDEIDLDTLQKECGSNIKKGSKEMLKFWLNRQPKASWNQLIEALKRDHIGLERTAHEIEKMLQPEGISLSTVVLNNRDR